MQNRTRIVSRKKLIPYKSKLVLADIFSPRKERTSLTKRKLGRCVNEILMEKLKRDKNNSSSNLIMDANYDYSRLKKYKVIKKGGKIRCSLNKNLPMEMYNAMQDKNLFQTPPYNSGTKQQLKIPESIFCDQDSLSISYPIPTFENFQEAVHRLRNKMPYKEKYHYLNRKNSQKKEINECRLSDTTSSISLLSSISAHNKLPFDNQEEVLHKQYAKHYKKISKKNKKDKNIINGNNSEKKYKITLNSRNGLIDDIFHLVKVFESDGSPIQNELINTMEINVTKDVSYEHLKVNLVPMLYFRDDFRRSFLTYLSFNLATCCFNVLPDLFFEHVYTPLNQIAIVSSSLPKSYLMFSKIVLFNQKSCFFFNEIFDQVFDLDKRFYFSSIDVNDSQSKIFSKVQLEFFIKEVLKISHLNTVKPLYLKNTSYSRGDTYSTISLSSEE